MFSLPRAVRNYPMEEYGALGCPFESVMSSNDVRYILRPSRDSGGLIVMFSVRRKEVVCEYGIIHRQEAKRARTHFKHTTPTLGAVVRTLGLRPPANATPPSRLRVIVRRRRGTEQRVFDANFVSTATSATATTDILRFGIWDGTRVACHAGDERAECKEGTGVDDEEVRDEV